MSTLELLSALSCLFVVWFIMRAYRDDYSEKGEQSRRQAIIEVMIGIVIGFFLNWVMNFLLLPLVGARFTGLQNFYLGTIYTSVSVMRGYAVRRWAERDIRRFSTWLARRFS
jgi:4-hydroxybenzoate polyprenyltransferase